MRPKFSDFSYPIRFEYTIGKPCPPACDADNFALWLGRVAHGTADAIALTGYGVCLVVVDEYSAGVVESHLRALGALNSTLIRVGHGLTPGERPKVGLLLKKNMDIPDIGQVLHA